MFAQKKAINTFNVNRTVGYNGKREEKFGAGFERHPSIIALTQQEFP